MSDEPQNLFAALGLGALPESEKAALTARLGALVQREVVARALEALSAKDRKALAALLDEEGDNAGRVCAFLEERIPDIDGLFREAVESLREELIASAQS